MMISVNSVGRNAWGVGGGYEVKFHSYHKL